jgi:hypothetical protein
MKALRNNGLSIVLAFLFLAFLGGQSLTGHRDENHRRKSDGESPISYSAYLKSGSFLESVFENWESEFFQMSFYVLLTVFLFQKGSSESKDPEKKEKVDEDPRRARTSADAPGPVKRGGWVLQIYEHSLTIAFVLLFALSFAGHAVSGVEPYNDERIKAGEPPVSVAGYVASSRFWFESFQNWQSEFLAVLAIVVLSIFLRQKGSPESKPVAAPHRKTGGG